MPKSTREWAIRELTSIKGHIDKVGEKLSTIQYVYQDQHPEIANVINVTLQLTAELLALIDRIII